MTYWWLRRRVHPSWLLAALFFGIIIGIVGSSLVPTTLFVSTAWVLVGIVLGGIALRLRRAYVLVLMLFAGGAIGLWRGGIYQQQLMPYARLVGQTVTVQGRVSEDPDKGKRGELVLRLGDIVIDDRRLTGTVWVGVEERAALRRSDEVIVKGELAEGFGSFAASLYRANLVKAERPVPGDVAVQARDWFAGGVRRAVAEPEASLGVGYVVGQRRSLPEDLDKALRAAGLTHIIVASGYNLTILVGVARRLFLNISKFLAALFSGGLTIGFIAVAGMSPSMSRAGLVTALGLLAWYYGRRFHPVVLLSLAAAATLIVNPAYGNGDLGWQLSFAAFAGVLIVAPLLQNYFYGEERPGIIRQVLGETMSAWLCTVPLIVLAFGQFSNVAILANILILPLVPLAMLLTFIAGIGALVVPPLAAVAGFPALVVLGYMTNMAHYLGGVPWAQTELTITPSALVVYYAALVAVCAYVWHKTRFDFVADSVANVDR